MYHRDYLIKMIQQWVVVMARILGLKSKDDPEVILIEVEQAMKHFSGMDPELIGQLTADSLTSIFKNREDYTGLAIVSILLKEEGLALRKMGYQEKGLHRLQKSLTLLEKVDLKKIPDEVKASLDFKKEIQGILSA